MSGRGKKSPAAHCAGSVLVALALFAASGADASAAAETGKAQKRFQAHRALYSMDLSDAARSASVTGASGTMFYRFDATCAGYEVETRVFMRLVYGAQGTAEVVETTWSFDSFESYEGDYFSFAVEHNRDGTVLERFQGEAHLDGGEGGTVVYDYPVAGEMPLPVGTQFPAEHLMALLAHAAAGKSRYSEVVFDGASTDNPYEINSYIVGRVVPGAEVADGGAKVLTDGGQPAEIADARMPFDLVAAADLAPSPVWRARLAYFPFARALDLPEFEIEVDYREDGVAQRIVQDFGDFSLDVTPVRFETLPAPACGDVVP